MKQPTKSTRPPILLDKLTRQDESSKLAEKDKNKAVAASTSPQ